MLWSRLPQRDLLLGSGGLGHQALIKEGEKKSEPSCWVTVISVIKHTIIRAGDCGCVGCVGKKHPRMTGIPKGGGGVLRRTAYRGLRRVKGGDGPDESGRNLRSREMMIIASPGS